MKAKKQTKKPAGVAAALALTPDGIRAALAAWTDSQPVELPTPPPALAGAVRSLLAAARLDPPGGTVRDTLAGCFVRLLDEWERKAAAADWPEYADALAADRVTASNAAADLAARGENPAALLSHGSPDEWARQALEQVAFSRAWRSYRLAQVARLSREAIHRAVAALADLSPDAVREAAQRTQARFALAGEEMRDYRGTPLPPAGADFDEAGETRRLLLEEAVRRALDELDGAARECARNRSWPAVLDADALAGGRAADVVQEEAVRDWWIGLHGKIPRGNTKRLDAFRVWVDTHFPVGDANKVRRGIPGENFARLCERFRKTPPRPAK